jgi:hypothetical protein
MVATILLIPALLMPPITSQPDDERTLMHYRAAVNTYAQLHREAESSVATPALCAGPEQIELARQELADEIRFLRRNAREGAVFSSEVGDIFRRRLTHALADLEMEAADVLAPLTEERHGRRAILEVNGFFPWEAGPPRWRELFWALPTLPDELEYRLVGADLVLLDVEARLVVDILVDAVR